MDLEKIARDLGGLAKLGSVQSFRPMEGGKNNRVVHTSYSNGLECVLKSYFFSENDQRDRLAAEFEFLYHVWNIGVRVVPQPLAKDEGARVGLYSFLRGVKVAPGGVTEGHVKAALNFALQINQSHIERGHIRPASEACFALDSHIDTVHRRVERLEHLDETAPFIAECRAFVRSKLRPLWFRLAEDVEKHFRKLGIDKGELLPVEYRCLSPSDFGFHNALIAPGGQVQFIDFEYAGLDDPAKLVCDFFCQPDVPIPFQYFEMFSKEICTRLGLPKMFQTRIELLMDVYRVKWMCIMLNDFVAVEGARRNFALGEEQRESRCARQLQRAEDYIAKLS